MTNQLFSSLDFEGALKQGSFIFGLWLADKMSGEDIPLDEEKMRIAINTFGLNSQIILCHVNKQALSDDFVDFLITRIGLCPINDGFISCLNDEKLKLVVERMINHHVFFNRRISKALVMACAASDIGLSFLLKVVKYFQEELTKRWIAIESDDEEVTDVYHPLRHEELTDIWSKWQLSHLSDISLKNLAQYIEVCTGVKYELADEHTLITYKGVKKDGTSAMSSKFKFESGKIYEEKADYDITAENSFGLSVWDYKSAEDFCPEKVLTCLIDYHDIKYVNFEDGRIRCSKFYVK